MILQLLLVPLAASARRSRVRKDPRKKAPPVDQYRCPVPLPQALHQVTRFGPELLGLLAVGLFVANMAAGKRSNEALAIKWARMFCGDGAVLERNFAQIIARADGGSEVRRRQIHEHLQAK